MKKTVCRAVVLSFVSAVCLFKTVFAAPPVYDIDLKELPPAVSRPKQQAERNKLEIDLKELRAELARKARPQKRRHAVRKPPAKAVPSDAAGSRYIVRPGDHIALILVRDYGLTEAEARQLMPEVMRLNSIHNPKAVASGRSLIIPLPRVAASSGAESEKQAGQASVSGTQEGGAVRTSAAAGTNIMIGYLSACSFARELLGRLGLLAESQDKSSTVIAFAAAYADLSATVLCYPSAAERITYERLSAIRGEQLIVISDKDSGRQIVGNIAARLAMSYSLKDTGRSGADNPAFTFVLSGADKPEKEITVTVENDNN